MNRRDRIIVPLDVATLDEAKRIIKLLGPSVHFYKIGYQLMSIGGCELAQSLSAIGHKIFLDFKFLDIGATVEKGVKSARALGGDFITIHAEQDALKGAVQGKGDDPRLKILAVTVLTSWDQQSLKRQDIEQDLRTLVLKRAETALIEGADGVVASAHEAQAIKKRFGTALIIVTPGIRPAGSSGDDQRRIVTPKEGILAGADHLVIGRPILNAPNPRQMVGHIQAEIDEALSASPIAPGL